MASISPRSLKPRMTKRPAPGLYSRGLILLNPKKMPMRHIPANNKPAHTIRQQNIYCIAMLVILCMFISVTTALNANDIARKNEKFVYEFNLAAGPVLYQESVDDIKSIAPGYKLDAKESMTAWLISEPRKA